MRARSLSFQLEPESLPLAFHLILLGKYLFSVRIDERRSSQCRFRDCPTCCIPAHVMRFLLNGASL